jgi:hypothetical protein
MIRGRSALIPAILISLTAAACSSSGGDSNGDNTSPTRTGGSGGRPSTGTGGTGSGSGGSVGSGGSTGSGGAVGSGGSTGSAGSTGSGDAATEDGGAGDGGGAAETGAGETGGSPETGSGDSAGGGSNFSFFITSRTGDGNLGGLAGADKICQDLAAAVGAGGKTWKAYLSTENPKVDAKTRIGNGPWYNVKGTKIADSLEALHMANPADATTPGNTVGAANGLTEKGDPVPSNEHDVLTGTNIDGTAVAGQTCGDWTGKATARVGHHNRMGGSAATGKSWNSAHDNAGCATPELVRMRGGAGRFYCFATTP